MMTSEMIADGEIMGGEVLGKITGENDITSADVVIKKIANKEKYVWLAVAILIVPCVFISCFARNVPNILLSLVAFTLNFTNYYDSEREELINE